MSNFEVAIIVGSTSDMHIAEKGKEVFEDESISYDLQVISAHREPERLDEYLKKTRIVR